MVRLQHAQRTKLEGVVCMFQFQNGAITAFIASSKVAGFSWFQFQNGAITALASGDRFQLAVAFQFQNGAITARMEAARKSKV